MFTAPDEHMPYIIQLHIMSIQPADNRQRQRQRETETDRDRGREKERERTRT